MRITTQDIIQQARDKNQKYVVEYCGQYGSGDTSFEALAEALCGKQVAGALLEDFNAPTEYRFNGDLVCDVSVMFPMNYDVGDECINIYKFELIYED